MRITSLNIGRFGVWEDLNLPKISRGLNVFFGPNEAGKTTLMQFIRTCLYGGADAERARYIQMSLDGRRRRERNAPAFDVLDATPKSIGATSESDGAKESSTVSASPDAARTWIGGAATVTSDFGDHRLERRYIRCDSSYRSTLSRKSGFLVSEGLINWSGRFYALPGLKIAESLVVVGPDGTRVGDYMAKSLTCNLDESTFNGVFAIGLDELQKLGMLNETEAAQMLYRLSVGVDRGAFVQVFQQIVAERNDLLDVKGRPSILKNLLSEREAARRKADASSDNLREYSRLLEERRAVVEATKSLQDRIDKSKRQKDVRELALRVAPVWDDRARVWEEIEAIGEASAVERDAVDECDRLASVVEQTRKKIREQKNLYRSKRDERDLIEVDPALDALEPRVSILEGDLPRLNEIDATVARLRVEMNDLNVKLADEEARVQSARNGKIRLTPAALDAVNASIASQSEGDSNLRQGALTPPPNKMVEAGVAFKEVEDFKKPAKRIRRRRLRLERERADLTRAGEKLNALVAKLEQGLTSHSQKNLTEAIERTGALLAGLRRRVEVEKHIGEMTSYRREVERHNKVLADNQAIVGAPLYALGAGVVVGGLIFGLSLFSGSVDITVGLVGLLAMIGCLFYKSTVEKKNRQKLEENQRQLGSLTKQLERAQAEARSLEERFPAPSNAPNAALETRLQKAKSDLAFFESLAPVEAQWREATKRYRAQEARVKEAEAELKKARKRWRAWLRDAYLPTTLKPTQIRDLFERVKIADDLKGRIAALVAEIEYLARERQGIVERFDAAVALLPKDAFESTSTPNEIVAKMRAMLGEYAEVLNVRAALLDEMNAVKKECRKTIQTCRRQSREARKYLAGFHVRRRDELVAAVERYASLCAKKSELDGVQRRLDDALAGFCSEEEIGALLNEQEVRDGLVVEIDNLTKRLEALDYEMKGKLELSGRLGRQAEEVVAKKDFIRARFDAAAYDLRLSRAASLWQSRAVAGQIMEDIRRAYEKDRQPETLREASRFLKRLTDGRYVNIWTPLGEDALYVDASNGETLDVAALSRGTRELLFIAVRLALVVSFEKHGVQTPLIWDDVLVNFDYKRAALAAKLLFDFAKAGRQIFLFTCHEHICRLFLKLGVPVCVLPTSNDPKRRRFRVMKPKKKAKDRDLTATVEAPRLGVDEPNFVETPKSTIDANVLSTTDPQEKRDPAAKNFVVEPIESEDKVETPVDDNLDVGVDESDSSKADARANEPTELVVEAPLVDSSPGFVATSFSSKRDGEESNSRALSEISPTFSTQGNDESEYRIVQEPVDSTPEANDGDGENDGENGDEESDFEITDYDQWGDVFANTSDARESDSTKDDEEDDFGDYLDSDSLEDDSLEDDAFEEEEDDEEEDYDFDEESEELEDE